MKRYKGTYYRNFAAMGTRFGFLVPGIDEEEGNRVFNLVRKEVEHWHLKLSRYEPGSDISLINREAGHKKVFPDPGFCRIVEQCIGFHQKTGGYFDITLPPLTTYWKYHATCPDPGKINSLIRQTGMNQLHYDASEGSLIFGHPEMQIDLGGFGKGFALEKVKDIIESAGIVHCFISFGESSILAMGSHPHGDHWPAGIQNIFETESIVCSFRLSGSSLSVSGASMQRAPAGEGRWGQVVNPHTGYPFRGWQTVAVQSNSPLEAEVLSTAILVAPEDKRKEMHQAFAETAITTIEYKNELPEIVQWEALGSSIKIHV